MVLIPRSFNEFLEREKMYVPTLRQLKNIEWAGCGCGMGMDWPCCPVCGAAEETKHKRSCWLAKMIQERMR